jgi:hypothetical protein
MDLHRQLLDAAQPTPVRKDGSRAKMRHDTVVAVEVMISVPSGAVDEASFFGDALAWIDQRFGVPVLSAVWHRDQGQEHVHCLLLPLKGGRMVGSGLAGRYDRMHDDFYRQVGQKHGLARKVRLDARSRKVGASMAMDALDANPALRHDPTVRAALLACIERDPGQLLQALSLIQERPPEKQWIETMTRPVTDSKPIGFDNDGLGAVAGGIGALDRGLTGRIPGERGPDIGHQVDDRTLSCVRVRHDPPPVDTHAAPAAGVTDPDDLTGLVVAQPGQYEGVHALLAGEAWLVLPTWQLSATCASTPPPIPQPIRLMFNDGASAPVDEAGDFLRVHEDEQPVECWDPVEGRMVMPPRPTPSARVRVDAVVAAALKARQTRST